MSVCVCVCECTKTKKFFAVTCACVYARCSILQICAQVDVCVNIEVWQQGVFVRKILEIFHSSLWRAQYVCENIEICVQIGVYVVKVKNFTHHVHIFVST